MKKLGLLLILVVLGNFIQAQEREKKNELYIQTYAKLAVAEMELYKIPASITLAQGILETGNGQSKLAQLGNNHFGIKCKNEWVGDRMYHDDDAKGECFRKYLSVKDSYRDHSLFLAERPYYKNLFLLDSKDYRAWAHGLKKSGYATNTKYAYLLIDIIERYKLYQFDAISTNQVDDKLMELYPDFLKPGISPDRTDPKIIIADTYKKTAEKNSKSTSSATAVKTDNKTIEKNEKKIVSAKTSNFEFPSLRVRFHLNGNLKYIVFKEGDSLEDISKAYNISVARLKSYNDLFFQDSLLINQKIFLEPKKKKGISKEHTVKEGETMYDIAQSNGILLIELYKRNLMRPGQEPKKGDKILLKGQKS